MTVVCSVEEFCTLRSTCVDASLHPCIRAACALHDIDFQLPCGASCSPQTTRHVSQYTRCTSRSSDQRVGLTWAGSICLVSCTPNALLNLRSADELLPTLKEAIARFVFAPKHDPESPCVSRHSPVRPCTPPPRMAAAWLPHWLPFFNTGLVCVNCIVSAHPRHVQMLNVAISGSCSRSWTKGEY